MAVRPSRFSPPQSGADTSRSRVSPKTSRAKAVLLRRTWSICELWGVGNFRIQILLGKDIHCPLLQRRLNRDISKFFSRVLYEFISRSLSPSLSWSVTLLKYHLWGFANEATQDEFWPGEGSCAATVGFTPSRSIFISWGMKSGDWEWARH